MERSLRARARAIAAITELAWGMTRNDNTTYQGTK